MSFLKKRWYIPVAAILLLCGVIGVYVVATTAEQPPGPERIYMMPKSRARPPAAVTRNATRVATVSVPAPEKIAVAKLPTREELFEAEYKRIENDLLAQLKNLNSEEARLIAEREKRDVILKEVEKINELTNWMEDTFTPEMEVLEPAVEFAIGDTDLEPEEALVERFPDDANRMYFYHAVIRYAELFDEFARRLADLSEKSRETLLYEGVEPKWSKENFEHLKSRIDLYLEKEL